MSARAAAAAADMGLWEAVDACRAAVGTATAAELLGGGSAEFYLDLAAVETAIARRAAVHAVISIHRALLAGASVRQIADVTGLSPDQVAARWAEWADGQVRLRERTGTGMAGEEHGRAAAVLAGRGWAAADDLTGPDSPALPVLRM
jgi:hypothetical protein